MASVMKSEDFLINTNMKKKTPDISKHLATSRTIN